MRQENCGCRQEICCCKDRECLEPNPCCENHDGCRDDETLQIRVGILEVKEGLKDICDDRDRDGGFKILCGVAKMQEGLRCVTKNRRSNAQRAVDCLLAGLSEICLGAADILECRRDKGICEVFKGIQRCEAGLLELCPKPCN
ncbi:MAG: hypothetical protein FWE69_07215 [Clostridiales bacterium]|nr:hypothetical protein [Clostridiales bacterium]